MRRIMKDRVKIISGTYQGKTGTIEDDPFWDVDYRAAVSVKLDSGAEVKVQARFVRRVKKHD